MKNHIYARDVEKDVYYKPEESKPEFEESIAERTKMRKLMKRTKESDEKNKKVPGLTPNQILTPNQMVSRLPIS